MKEFKRQQKIVDEIKIGDEVLQVCIEPDVIARDYNKVQSEIIRRKLEVAELIQSGEEDNADIGAMIEAAHTALGAAVVELMRLLFGAESTEKIISFYDGRYTEMLNEVVPYINNELMPKMEAALKEIREKWAADYKAQAKRGKAGKVSGFALWKNH